MNLKTIIIPILLLLYSGCSSKEDFYRGAYNFIQDNTSCSNYPNNQECKRKKFEENRYSPYENQEQSYDEYKSRVSQK